nr:putative ribonuclease H-like domain-containing protein [Tanacetum cinerariifolium]
MGDEHLDTIPATESDKVIKSSVEDLVPIPSEFEGISDTMCDVYLVNNPTPLEAKDHVEIVTNDDDSLYNENIEYVEASPHDSKLVSLEVAEIVILEEEEIEDDNLREKLLNIHLLIANIEALKDNPTPSSEFLTKSSSTSSRSFLEETYTFHNSFPEFENFYLNLEEISSGSTTTHSDISFTDYEAFYFDDDHIEEISNGSTTTHSDVSLFEYDSFTFDLSNDQCPPTDRSDFTHEEFVDELAHIISPPKYDCFYFRNFPDLGELMSILNSGIRENLSSTTYVNLPIEDDHSPLLAYVVWIFLTYLTYPVIPPYLHSFGNEDTIFDPGITINRVYSFKPGLSHRCEAFKKFNTHLNTATPTYADYPNDPLMPDLEDVGIFDDAYDDRDEGMEPKKVTQALDDESCVETMQEELLQFKLLNVWTLVDLPPRKRAIGTKWVYRNKRDQRGIVVINKGRLEIKLFLAYASFMDFTVFQMDVKSSFLYGTIKEEVYVIQPLGFVDPDSQIECTRWKKLYMVFIKLLEPVKRIFRYLKGQPTLGLWYPKDSPLELIAYSDSDYAGASLDKKSTTGGCQFLDSRLISWQCKKQTIMANSTTKAEYIAASNCRGQVLWLQNQLLHYGYNFMQTKIHVDNEIVICVVKNPIYHSKTKHIEIRHHFIRDFYKKRLIEMIKIHTDYNVSDLLTKAFDVTRFQFLIASIGLELKGYLINDGYADLVQHVGDY